MADQLLQQAGYPPHLGTPTDQHQTHPIGQDHNPAVLDQDQDPAVLDQDPTDLANQQGPLWRQERTLHLPRSFLAFSKYLAGH